jgi:hypothetical protein
MVSLWNGKLMTWQVDEMVSWWNGKLMKWQVDDMASWWHGKLMKRKVGEMASWWNGKLTKWPATKVSEESLKNQSNEASPWWDKFKKIKQNY